MPSSNPRSKWFMTMCDLEALARMEAALRALAAKGVR